MRSFPMFACTALLLASVAPAAAQPAPDETAAATVDTLAGTTATSPLVEGLRRPNPNRVAPRSITRPDTIGVPLTADGKYPWLRLGMDAATAWQALDHEGDTLASLSPGFQAAVGNLYLSAGLVKGIDVYAEFYMGSKGHQGQFYDREGYVMLSELPESWDILGLNRVLEHVDVKAGHFEIDFGNQHRFRSDNAQVQRNPLIGNFIVDENTVEAGFEVIGHAGMVHALAGYGGGVTTENFLDERGSSLHGKVWLEPADSRWNVAASVYRVDHSDTPAKSKGGSWTELFSGNRSGSRYSKVLNGGGDAGQVNFGAGKDVTAWQMDAFYQAGRVWLNGMVGGFEDADMNGTDEGTPSETWSFYGVEGKIDVIPQRLYGAARYGRATTDRLNDVPMDAYTDRVQLGLGWWMFDNMLFKTEYVTQRFRDFTAVRWMDEPEFSGFLIEGSLSF